MTPRKQMIAAEERGTELLNLAYAAKKHGHTEVAERLHKQATAKFEEFDRLAQQTKSA
jgi:hypothetical protein